MILRAGKQTNVDTDFSLSLCPPKFASRPQKATRVRTVDFLLMWPLTITRLSNLELYFYWQVNVIKKLPSQRYSQHSIRSSLLWLKMCEIYATSEYCSSGFGSQLQKIAVVTLEPP